VFVAGSRKGNMRQELQRGWNEMTPQGLFPKLHDMFDPGMSRNDIPPPLYP
jgi:hypothetical protein